MNIKHDQQKDFHIIEVDGEININTSIKLRKAFGDTIAKETKKVLIDLNAVDYIDSSGLATLVELMQILNERNAKMFLVGISKKVLGVIEITKLDKYFSIYATREEIFALQD